MTFLITMWILFSVSSAILAMMVLHKDSAQGLTVGEALVALAVSTIPFLNLVLTLFATYILLNYRGFFGKILIKK